MPKFWLPFWSKTRYFRNRYSSVNEDSSSYLPSSSSSTYTSAETHPASLRSTTSYQSPTTSSYTPYNSISNNNNGNLRQSLSSSRLNNNNNNSSNGSNKYGRLSRHFSFDDDASNDAMTSFQPVSSSSYMSPESYVTLTRRRRHGEPSVVEKYFTPVTSSASVTSPTPLSRQGSRSTFEGRDTMTSQTSFPPRPSPARFVASLSKSSSSGNAII